MKHRNQRERTVFNWRYPVDRERLKEGMQLSHALGPAILGQKDVGKLLGISKQAAALVEYTALWRIKNALLQLSKSL